MSCLDGTRSLTQFSIPGTHDSGAMIEPFPGTAKTQDLTIAQQLDAGIRFLDIRCRHENDSFSIYHGFVPQLLTFDDVLNSTFAFLDANPGETVIMSVKEEFDPMNNTRSFEATFDSYVAQNPTQWRLAADTPTLDAARGKIVLFRRFGATSLPKGIDASSFPDNTTFTTGARLRVQDRYVVPANDDGNTNDSKWRAIQSMLGEAKYGAPGMLYVNFCSGYTPDEFGVPNITVVSDDINLRLAMYLIGSYQNSGHFGVILMDFADASLTKFIYDTNAPMGGRPAHRPAYFTIINRHSGKAIDLAGGNIANGAQINQWDHDAGPDQRWVLAPTEQELNFRLSSWVSGRCATMEGNSTATGAKLVCSENLGTFTSQHFELIDAGDGYFKIRNVNSNLVLEVENSQAVNNARIQQNTDIGATNQQWRLLPLGDYRIQTLTSQYITTEPGDSATGDAIEEQDWESAPWFRWRLDSAGDGYLKATSLNLLTHVISIPGGSMVEEVDCKLEAYDPANTGEQRLRIVPLPNGRFKFYFVHSGLPWSVNGGQTALEQFFDFESQDQEFQLEQLPSVSLASAEHQWRCENFTIAQIYDPALEATVWGRDANPDGDEWDNFEEFAFGGDPNDGADQLDAAFDWKRTAGGDLHATFPRLRGALLNYQMLVSENLIDWTSSAATGGPATSLDGQYEKASLLQNFDPVSDPRRFMIIRATE